MNDASRRGFLTMAGAGAAAGVVIAVAPGASAVAPKAATEDESLPAGAQGSMAAYIHDLAKGQVTLMVDGHEVTITDKPLAARLARAFARADVRANVRANAGTNGKA